MTTIPDLLVGDDTLELGLEPLHGIITGHAVLHANNALLVLAASDTIARASQHDVEVHAVNAGRRVVLQTQIDVLINAEAEVAGGREVLSLQLVLLHLQTQVQDLLGALTTDSDVCGDLFIAADREGAHGVTSW